MANSLSLDPIVDITVNLPLREAAAGRNFDLVLVVGKNDVIPVDERVRIYKTPAAMLEDGFLTSDSLYQAAALVLSQNPSPSRVAIGSIGAVRETVAYDELTEIPLAEAQYLLQESNPDLASSAKAGQFIWYDADLAVTRSGAYSIGKTAPEESGSISEVKKIVETEIDRDESPEEYLSACRTKNDEWYVVTHADELDAASIEACAEYIEHCTPSSVFAFTTKEDASLTGAAGIFSTLKGKGYRRSFGQYSSTSASAVAAIMGYAAGMMEEDEDAFSLAYKLEQGVQTENTAKAVTEQSVSKLLDTYGNIYVNRGGYSVFQSGTCCDGTFFDEILFLDFYTHRIQTAVMDLLTSEGKVPQTEAGMTKIVGKINSVCSDMAQRGFISAGIWLGETVKNLKKGDTLPNGFKVQADAIEDQTQEQRNNRVAPNIYVSLKLAGAIHFVTIVIDVNR